MEARTHDPPRLASLDQFRGYTVLGMFVVNFVGSYEAIKELLPVLGHHHTYFSYADSIMPQFFFAVGFAYRMTFLRRLEKDGARAAYWHAFQRVLALLLVAFIVHTLGRGVSPNTWARLNSPQLFEALAAGLKRDYFQTLTHIAVTSLWVLPVIAARPGTRVLWMLGSAAMFHILSEAWYYKWVNTPPNGIDGGPLGFLTWTIPLIVGTLAYDAMSSPHANSSPHAPREEPGEPTEALKQAPVSRSETPTKLILWSIALMLLGYGLSCLNHLTPPNTPSEFHWSRVLVEPPFVPPAEPVNIWTMSQRSGSVSYLTFGAGFSLAVYALFVLACDIGVGRIFNPSGTEGNSVLQLGIFRTLGTNALAGYILHDLVAAAVKPWVPKDSPLWYVAVGCGVFLAICYVLLRYMEKHKLFLKL